MSVRRKVTAVVLHYGKLEYTIECVQSVLRAAVTELEVVVVNNAGDADCIRELHVVSNVRVVTPVDNMGFSGGNNFALRSIAGGAESDLVLFINNDAVLERGALETMVQYIDDHDDVGMVSPLIVNYDDGAVVEFAGGNVDAATGRTSRLEVRHVRNEGAVRCTFLIGCVVLLKYTLIHSLGGWNEWYYYLYEDVELSYRVRAYGKVCVCHYGAVARHRSSKSLGSFSLLYKYYEMRNMLHWYSTSSSRTRSLGMVRKGLLYGSVLLERISLRSRTGETVQRVAGGARCGVVLAIVCAVFDALRGRGGRCPPAVERMLNKLST